MQPLISLFFAKVIKLKNIVNERLKINKNKNDI